MSLQSRHLFTLFMTLHPVMDLGHTPAGGRRIFAVSGGSFEGERISGTVSPLIGSDLLLGRRTAHSNRMSGCSSSPTMAA